MAVLSGLLNIFVRQPVTIPKSVFQNARFEREKKKVMKKRKLSKLQMRTMKTMVCLCKLKALLIPIK